VKSTLKANQLHKSPWIGVRYGDLSTTAHKVPPDPNSSPFQGWNKPKIDPAPAKSWVYYGMSQVKYSKALHIDVVYTNRCSLYMRVLASVTISSRCLYNRCLSCVCAVSHRERCHKTMNTQDNIVQDENITPKNIGQRTALLQVHRFDSSSTVLDASLFSHPYPGLQEKRYCN